MDDLNQYGQAGATGLSVTWETDPDNGRRLSLEGQVKFTRTSANAIHQEALAQSALRLGGVQCVLRYHAKAVSNTPPSSPRGSVRRSKPSVRFLEGERQKSDQD